MISSYFLRSKKPSETMGEETSETVPAWLKTLIEAQEAARLQQEETIRTLLATLATTAGQPSSSNTASDNNTNNKRRP